MPELFRRDRFACDASFFFELGELCLVALSAICLFGFTFRDFSFSTSFTFAATGFVSETHKRFPPVRFTSVLVVAVSLRVFIIYTFKYITPFFLMLMCEKL